MLNILESIRKSDYYTEKSEKVNGERVSLMYSKNHELFAYYMSGHKTLIISNKLIDRSDIAKAFYHICHTHKVKEVREY